MQTIGVLGGFGPEATTVFENQVHEEARLLLPPKFNQGYPPMVTVHLRHAPVLLEDGAPPSGPLRIDPRVLEAAGKLGRWADFLVIVANTPHLFVDEIEEAAGVPVLSMIDLVMEELGRRGFAGGSGPDARSGSGPDSASDSGPDSRPDSRPDSGPQRGAGVVGLLGLGVPQAYVDRFERDGVEWLGATTEVRAGLDDAILRTLELSTTEDHRAAAGRAVAELRLEGAGTIVLGCTEIPLLLGPGAEADDLIDPGRLLARAAVRRAIGGEREATTGGTGSGR